jgi:hypothetical protein
VSAAGYPAPRRWSGVLLPEDPSEEELARNWTLSEADRREAAQCRGDENRRHFALQLCVLRRHGRLLESGEIAPVRILNHLGAQLELPPVLFAAGALRPATEKPGPLPPPVPRSRGFHRACGTTRQRNP